MFRRRWPHISPQIRGAVTSRANKEPALSLSLHTKSTASLSKPTKRTLLQLLHCLFVSDNFVNKYSCARNDAQWQYTSGAANSSSCPDTTWVYSCLFLLTHWFIIIVNMNSSWPHHVWPVSAGYAPLFSVAVVHLSSDSSCLPRAPQRSKAKCTVNWERIPSEVNEGFCCTRHTTGFFLQQKTANPGLHRCPQPLPSYGKKKEDDEAYAVYDARKCTHAHQQKVSALQLNLILEFRYREFVVMATS